MSRNYANIWTAIWRNREFRALNVTDQWLYLQLVSQPDISAVGVLHLSERRWAGNAQDVNPDDILKALHRLQAARFVVFDTDTDEVLVRSFVRWDKGYTNPKRRPVIRQGAGDVISGRLRTALAYEFGRLELPTEWADQGDSHSDTQADGLPAVPNPGNQSNPDTTLFDLENTEANSLLDRQPDTEADTEAAEERVVVTKGLYLDTWNQEPQPATRVRDARDDEPATAVPDHGTRTIAVRVRDLTNTYLAAEPLADRNKIQPVIRRVLTDGRWTDDDIRHALQRLAANSRAPTINTLRIELTGPPRAAPVGRPSTADSAALDALKIAHELEQQELEAS